MSEQNAVNPQTAQQLLDVIAAERTTLLWTRDGEVKEIHPLIDVAEKAIENEEPTFSYVSEVSESGTMIAKVFIFGGGCHRRGTMAPRRWLRLVGEADNVDKAEVAGFGCR